MEEPTANEVIAEEPGGAAATAPLSYTLRSHERVIAAVAGSFVSGLLFQPLEVIKVRLQSQETLVQSAMRGGVATAFKESSGAVFGGAGGGGAVLATTAAGAVPASVEAATFTSPWNALVNIVRCGGVTVLWRGLGPTLLMSVPATTINFTVYEGAKDAIVAAGYPEWVAPLTAGTFARFTTATATAPLELLRTIRAAESSVTCVPGTRMPSTPRASSLSIFRRLMSRGGFQTVFQGLVPTLWRDVPFSAFYWTGYERVRVFCMQDLDMKDGVPVNFVAGAVSGSIAAVLTTPMDVVKTRMQVDIIRVRAPGEVIQRPKFMPILISTFQTEGVSGLFTGLVPRVAKVAPACAVMISSYHAFKSFFEEQRQRQ